MALLVAIKLTRSRQLSAQNEENSLIFTVVPTAKKSLGTMNYTEVQGG